MPGACFSWVAGGVTVALLLLTLSCDSCLRQYTQPMPGDTHISVLVGKHQSSIAACKALLAVLSVRMWLLCLPGAGA
jgi:hypothetical protein